MPKRRKKHFQVYKKAKCRRSVPQHALPNEIWRMLLGLLPKKPPECENVYLGQGVGFVQTTVKCISFCKLIFQQQCVIRKTRVAPMSWHLRTTFSLPKKDPSDVNVPYDAQRSIHTSDPYGKSFYKHVLDCAEDCTPLPNEYGY